MRPGAQGAHVFLCTGAAPLLCSQTDVVILHIWLQQAAQDVLRHPRCLLILVRRRSDFEHLGLRGSPRCVKAAKVSLYFCAQARPPFYSCAQAQ